MKHTVLSFVAVALFATAVFAQQPVLKLTATSVNVSEPGNPVRIDLARWSTDQERGQLATALTPPAPAPVALPAPPAAAAPVADAEDAATTRGGRGGARGGAGGARGGGAGGGRGGGARGGRGANAGPVDPIAAFTTAVDKAPTIGYIWTNEVTGYAIKYALRLPFPDADDRIILATNRRIGANALSWTPTSGTPTAYDFTVVEIRLHSGGSGEAKTSLTTSIALDGNTRTIGLENYAATPSLLANVRRQP